MTIILNINFNIAHPLSVHTFAIIYRTPQGILIHEKSFAAEFSSEDIVMYSTNASADSVAVQLHVSLPEGASRPDATTAHVLPLSTLQQVFDDSGDIIMGYTLSCSLTAAVAGSSDQSK